MISSPFPLRDLLSLPAKQGSYGNKIKNLCRLEAGGFSVPSGVVVGPHSRPPTAAELSHLGESLAARSSSNIEDTVQSSFAGLFTSVVPLQREQQAIEQAIERVRASADTDAVKQFVMMSCGVDNAPRKIEMSVLLHEFIPADIAHGTMYTKDPTEPARDTICIEARRPGDSTVLFWRSDRDDGQSSELLTPAQLQEVARLGRAIGSFFSWSGCDIEWVWSKRGLTVLQARPLVLSASNELVQPPEHIFEPLQKSQATWLWDFPHNPDPLSPAQAALVERQVSRGYDMRLIGGYLYYRKQEPGNSRAGKAYTGDDLARLFFGEVVPESFALLSEVEALEPPPLELALSIYDQIYDLYFKKFAPVLSAIKNSGTAEDLTCNQVYSTTTSEPDRMALSPAWDVSVPTFYESAGILPTETAKSSSGFFADVCELDDRLFYRAQYAVRRALQALATENGLETNQIFYCDQPFSPAGSSEELSLQIIRNRAQNRQARSWHMPARFPLPDDIGDSRDDFSPNVFSGWGWGGTATGTVVKLVDGQLRRTKGKDAETPNAKPPALREAGILLAADVPPSLLAAGHRFAGVVTEAGGPLGHGATLARELGIPCVVGCKNAWRSIDAGDAVLVDGARGKVFLASK